MKKSELTRQSIIEAAELLFKDQAIEKVPVLTIAKKAGVAKGTVYLYFESKDDIVWAVIEKTLGVITPIFNTLAIEEGSLNSVDTIIDTIFKFIDDYHNEMIMMHQTRFFDYLGIEKIEMRFKSLWIDLIKRWLTSGVEQGHYALSNVDFYADFIFGSFHGVLDCYLVGKSPYALDYIRDELKIILWKLLG